LGSTMASDFSPQIANINKLLLEKIRVSQVEMARKLVSLVVRKSNPSVIETIVDGVHGRSIEDVQPFGVIEVHFGYDIAEIISAAIEILSAVSPIKTGAYQRSHQVYINGSMVSDIAELGSEKNIVIASTLPYSNKIEHGQSPQAPDGVYSHAAETLARRFGNKYHIEAGWAGFGGGAVMGGSAGNKSAVRYPALIIDRIAP